MKRPGRKQFWFWAVGILVLAAVLWSLPPVRMEYHKGRLQSTKARKARLVGGMPSGLDKLRLQVTGDLPSGAELDAAIRSHEDALVKLRFLHQEKLPAQMVSACSQTVQALDTLRSECPWYRAETICGTNLVVTACPKMMDGWRKRAKELGW